MNTFLLVNKPRLTDEISEKKKEVKIHLQFQCKLDFTLSENFQMQYYFLLHI